MTIHWETRLRGNTPKFIDIFPVGAADSSGAIARVPIRDGYFSSNLKTAELIAKSPELLAAVEELEKLRSAVESVLPINWHEDPDWVRIVKSHGINAPSDNEVTAS